MTPSYSFSIWCLSAVLVFSAGPLHSAPGRFHFKEPHVTAYRIEDAGPTTSALGQEKWVQISSESAPELKLQVSSRVALKLENGTDLDSLISGQPLEKLRSYPNNLFVLQAPDPRTALEQADRLAKMPGVLVSSPVMRRPVGLHSFEAPNDPLYPREWNLENRGSNGLPAGIDLNVRAAWEVSRGQGANIAFGDDGVEYTHPDLSAGAEGMPHFNFTTQTNDGMPVDTADKHGTAVAGLAVAQINNETGIAGVAPEAKFASWKIFYGDSLRVDDEGLMTMFEYQPETIHVQNHSWGNIGLQQFSPGYLASQGVETAALSGRSGKGTVMVRAAGNLRLKLADVNDDGYSSSPYAICVAAIRGDGRVAKYSSSGAPLLVAAPSHEVTDAFFTIDPTYPFLCTTDRQGANGYNTGTNNNDYVFNGTFGHTSGAASQISGICALILSVNTNLTYRDVQQILILSSRQLDLADPCIQTNGAGFAVSHNVGFGVPDAAAAVALARTWSSRSAVTNVVYETSGTFTDEQPASIPDDGLRVLFTDAAGVQQSIPASPSLGLHPDKPTSVLPLVHVGLATNAITENLTNKAALIGRGGADFAVKIRNAARAGAAFAIVYDNTGTTNRIIMGSTDFVSIPAVSISKNDGEWLINQLAQTNVQVQLGLASTNYTFTVTEDLLCEHVALRVRTDHRRRADVRITLTSPQGTTSVLQHLNNDTNSVGPIDWTYYTTQHFFESSYGNWTVSVSDEAGGATGSVLYASLVVKGVPINDSDHDGLDDHWETENLGSLNYNAQQDPDGNGLSNMRDQLAFGTRPVILSAPASLTSSPADSVTLCVNAAGARPLIYQWRKNGTNLSDSESIIGANLSCLTLSNVQAGDQGSYSVVISNTRGSVTNPVPVEVTVLDWMPPALSFTSHADRQVVRSSLVTLRGTATDDDRGENGIYSVLVNSKMATNGSVLGAATAEWSSPLTLSQGTNVIHVTATDLGGNRTDATLRLILDKTAPTCSVNTVPARTTNAVLGISGGAADYYGVSGVKYQLNGSSWSEASSTNLWKRWSATLELVPGANRLAVCSVDWAGNFSRTNSYVVFYSVMAPLELGVTGLGRISPNYTNALEIGRNYTITALPGAGQVFSNWTGGVSSQSPQLTFTMQSNLSLTANFVPNPFPQVKGAYNGLFFETNAVRHQSSGFFTMNVMSNGAFSGKILMEGGTNTFGGQFDVGGNAQVRILRQGKPAVTNCMALNFESRRVSGTLGNAAFVAELQACRAEFGAGNPATNYQGKYTMIIPGANDPAIAPFGDGYATMSVDLAGMVSARGALADGSSISQNVKLGPGGEWPFYVPLYGGKGSILGWITLDNNSSQRLQGTVSWIKPAQLASKYYPAGFTNVCSVAGSAFKTQAGHTLLGFTNGIALLEGGNLSQNLENGVEIRPNNTVVTVDGTNGLALTLNTTNGMVSGRFRHPQTGQTNAIRGVLLQDLGQARGYFLATNQSGLFILSGD